MAKLRLQQLFLKQLYLNNSIYNILSLKKGYRREKLNPHCKPYPRHKYLTLCNKHNYTHWNNLHTSMYQYKYKIEVKKTYLR